jgi:hypothetical protein
LKKLLLVNPVGRRSGYMMSRISRFAPLGLGYIAAATQQNGGSGLIGRPSRMP